MIIVNHIGTSVVETLNNELKPFVKVVTEATKEKTILAFSSKRAVEKLKDKDIIVAHIDDVIEHADEMIKILPVHLVGGSDLVSLKEKYPQLDILPPLLSNHDDCNALAKVLSNMMDLSKHTMFFGHGTSDQSQSMYRLLENSLKTYTDNVSVWTLTDDISQFSTEDEIVMFPLFTVAGHHVKKDLFQLPTSFKCQLLNRGYQVTTIEKGLLSYETIRQLYIRKLVR